MHGGTIAEYLRKAIVVAEEVHGQPGSPHREFFLDARHTDRSWLKLAVRQVFAEKFKDAKDKNETMPKQSTPIYVEDRVEFSR